MIEELKIEEKKEKVTLVIFGGLSNDVEPIGTLVINMLEKEKPHRCRNRSFFFMFCEY
ncbi:MAG: hypothetical protein M3162_09455 [Thermoproteota archaeon]|nr:hypothetical protein [Thermoproteota archaeon]